MQSQFTKIGQFLVHTDNSEKIPQGEEFIVEKTIRK